MNIILYAVKFITEGTAPQQFQFQTVEKPVKGEVYTIQEVDGNTWEAQITEVTKVIIKTTDEEASIQYNCTIKKYSDTKTTIGFGSRS